MGQTHIKFETLSCITIGDGLSLISAPKGATAATGQTCKEKHVRRFKNGLVARLEFDMRDGQVHQIDCYWNKELTRKRVKPIYAEYLAWRNEAFRIVAEKYGLGNTLVIDLPEVTANQGGEVQL